jgi:ubiquinone/menaquinone biosynthesis C-methylase UbiE
LAELLAAYDEDTAMRLVVGGNWDALGQLERDLLISVGLEPEAILVDVGCGSGRLAVRLSDYLLGEYVGTDILPRLLDYARRTVGRPDWRFEHVEGLTLPVADHSVDMVCFFSVFTHLLHEEIYVYLRESARAVKQGGTVVFSFLDFGNENHWPIFESMIAAIGAGGPHNQFLSRDAIERFAERLGFDIVAIHGAMARFIPLSAPALYDDGRRWDEMGALGQSVCVLRSVQPDDSQPSRQE